MAFQSYRTRFQGELQGININQVAEIDNTKEKLKERMDFIKNKHEIVVPFHNDFIDNYYKVALNSDDELSEQINIFKYLEREASYLINSRDIPRDKQQKYKILDERDFKKLIAREQSLEYVAGDTDIDDSDTLTIVKREETNDYIGADFKITKKDLQHERAGQVLSCYDKGRQHLKDEMQKIRNKEESYLNLYNIKRILKGINSDMILAKVQLRGIRCPAKRLGDIGSAPDFDSIDYTNQDHIKKIIKFVKFGEIEPDSMLSHIAYDMQKTIEELHNSGKIDDMDKEIVECFNFGMSNVDIAKEIGRTENAVRQRLNKIFKRIADYHKERK